MSAPPHTRRVYLLGQLRVETPLLSSAEAAVSTTLPGSNSSSLFSFLLLHPHRAHSREQLADLLWPDAPPSRARRNLSDTLYRFRQQIGDDWLIIDREHIALNNVNTLWVDVWAFEAFIKQGDSAALVQAVGLYQGDLLPDIYDDWVLERRLALHETYLSALQQLAITAEKQHQHSQSHAYYTRLVYADPLREGAHRGVMRALARMDRLADALVAYADLEQLLTDEMGIAPTAETQTLAAQLRSELALTQKAAALSQENLLKRPFVGRIQERTLALTAVDQAIHGHGSLLAIEGEAGIGKSSLLDEIETGAAWRGVTIIHNQICEYPTATSFGGLADALTIALAPPRAAQLETMLPPETCAAIAPLFPAWGAMGTLPTLPPARTQERFQQAVVAVFGALAALSPHLFILDDLHWADADLWELLDAIVPTVAQQRLLFIFSYRRADMEKGAGWGKLGRWQRDGQLRVLPLKPLAVDEVAQLLPPSMQAEAERVQISAGGNPFYISEMMIALAEGHAPYGQTAVSRARSLPQPIRAALEAAAIIGKRVPYRLWATIVDLSAPDLVQAGDLLTDRFLLQPITGGYRFSHDLIQHAIYEQIEPAYRQRLHRLAADALAAQEGDHLRARAYHLDKAIDVDKPAAADVQTAVSTYCQAGEQELARFAFADAQAAFGRALQLMPIAPTRARVETLLALIEACHITGDREQQQIALDEALQAVETLGDSRLLTRVRLLAGKMATKMGQHPIARAHLDQALARAEKMGDVALQIEALLLLGDLAIRDGRHSQAKTDFETAVSLAQSIQSQQYEGQALDGFGFALVHLESNYADAIRYLDKALTLRRASGDQLGAARTLVNLLSAYQSIGAWDKVLARAEEAYEAQTAVSYRLGMAAVRQTQGLAACMLGDFAAAHQQISRARDGFVAAKDEIGVSIATDALGLVAERQGNVDEAVGYYRDALAIAQAAHAETFAAYAQQDLGALLVTMGVFDEAIILLETAVSNWQQQGDELNALKCNAALALALLATGKPSRAAVLADAGWIAFENGAPTGEEPQIWLWTLHRLLKTMDRVQQAETILEAAYQELQRQAHAIADHTMRHRFFALVPTNRVIVAAYDEQPELVRGVEWILARQDAPLGRRLVDEEKTAVLWTIHAPEDEAIGNKTALRRHRLERLLREADAQHAAPTDDDLAQALAVSRRTILRDMEQLAQNGVQLPTRRRR